MTFLLLILLLIVFFMTVNNATRLSKIEQRLLQLKKGVGEESAKRPLQEKILNQPDEIKPIQAKSIEIKPVKLEKQNKEKANRQFESKLATQFPVWIGGIALALGGFYLVKYSIDTGLLSPAVRVMLALILGLTLVLFGQKQNLVADNITSRRISQSLTGAGLATLYGALYAATSLYEFVPGVIGFVGMAMTTGLAILLSLRQGPPIALLGLLGGFLTPAIIGSDSPSVINLFSYLFVLYAAVLILARHRSWLWIVPLASAASYMWVLFWYFVYAVPTDSFWLMMFVVAALGLSLSLSKNAMEEGRVFQAGPLVYLGSTIAGLLTFFTLSFDVALQLEQVVLFGLLSASTFVLAYFGENQYRLYPVMSFITAFSILVTAGVIDTGQYLIYFLAAFILFVGGASILYFRHGSRIWGGMIFACGLLFYAIGYIYFRGFYDLGLSDTLWASLALAYALLGIYLVSYVYEKDKTDTLALAIFAAQATSFVALAMAVLWSTTNLHFFELGLLFEMVALIYIARWLGVKILNSYAAVLAVLYMILNLESLFSIGFFLLFQSLFSYETTLPWSWTAVLVERFAYIVPAFLFLLAGYKVESHKKELSAFFSSVGWVLLYVGVVLILSSFIAGDRTLKLSYLFNAVVLNLTFAFAVLILYLNRLKGQSGYYALGLSFVFFGLFRLLYGHLLLGNPLWADTFIDGVPLLNTLWLAYALPVAWLYLVYRAIALFKPFLTGFTLFMAFVFVTLQVRSFFHLPLMSDSLLSNAEVYSYSVAWLLSAAVAMFFGLLRKNQTLRYAGLGLMFVVAAKVFLYDASELEGLYRVISFLGLGASLIGLSYVYARFVQDK